MINYRKVIIEKLLDKYERSKSFIAANTVNQSFTLQLEKEFSEYGDDAKIAEIKAIDEAVEELRGLGLIDLKRRKNGLLYGVTLMVDKLPECYTYLKRKPKREVNQDLLELFRKYETENEVLSRYCAAQIQRLSENRKPEFFKDSIEDLRKVLMATAAIFRVEQETYIRDFSVKVFGNSKIFEKIQSTVVSLLFEYGDFPEKESLLEDMNLIKNPGHIFFKGSGIIRISGQEINLRALHGDIAISSAMLNDVEMIQATGRNVVTIENLTTFNSYQAEDALVLYLGGYHNTARREFIKKLYKENPSVEYYHYGDIDAGGFYILQHLRKKTGVDFKSLHMDIETLRSNLQFAKKLTENDEKRLRNLLGSEFDEVVRFMIENNCKLEQEALDNEKIWLR